MYINVSSHHFTSLHTIIIYVTFETTSEGIFLTIIMRQRTSQLTQSMFNIDKTESRRIAVGWSRVGEVYKYKVSMGESVSSEDAHVLR